MSATAGLSDDRVPAGERPALLEERLERGEVLHFPTCPFALPEGEDRSFLFQQQLSGRRQKNLSWGPSSGRTSGFPQQAEQAERLRAILASFGAQATAWLARTLPRYAERWRRDRINLEPAEEATRRLRVSARNDLLHLDAYPNRPTHGWRILRLFVNINLTDPRIWLTSDTFPNLLARYGEQVGLPTAGEDSWTWQLGQTVVGLVRPGHPRRSVYDSFMLRLHHFLKANDLFQEGCRKRVWNFVPGAVWVVFTDLVSHAVLRGRYALDHSFFVAPESLLLPELSPPVLLRRACGVPVLRRAA